MNEEATTSELPDEVVERIHFELEERAGKLLAALRTASAFLTMALTDESGLRLAESATYNLREALDAVVAGRTPVEGGLSVVVAAWQRFEDEMERPGNDNGASFEALKLVMRRAAEKQDRDSYHAAKLMDYLLEKAGIDPISGALDPVVEYRTLRQKASDALHSSMALAAATELKERTTAWIIRMFTPPDAVVRALRQLAAEPWRGEEQIARLRRVASNLHHLRLFFAELEDAAWLVPLHAAGVVTLPKEGNPWPVSGFLDKLGRTDPAGLATLMKLLLADSKKLSEPARLEVRFQLLIIAAQLGAEGNVLVGDIATAYPDNRHVRSLAVGAVKAGNPTDEVVRQVARVVLKGDPLATDRYYYKTVLDQLEAGLTAENFAGRFGMLVAKVREAAGHDRAAWVAMDIARLTAELGDDERHYLVITTYYLARLLDRADEFGMTTAQAYERIKTIPGAIGERLTCRVLARADDVTLTEKIEHISRRLRSSTATGDDKELVDAITAQSQDGAELSVWRDAFGSPSEASDESLLPRDWARAWRWSAVLPTAVLSDWVEQIARVSAQHGTPDPAFDKRIPPFSSRWGQSAYSADELAALPVADAARLVAQWRPGEEPEWTLGGATELARALQTAVEASPAEWSEDPVGVVRSLREPVYVMHYFNGMAGRPADVSARSGSIIAAMQLTRSERWAPTALGNDVTDYEPDWDGVDTAAVELVGALASSDAPLQEHLDTIWGWTVAQLDRVPREKDYTDNLGDAFERAINNRRGRGMRALLALAAWEYRNVGTIRGLFEEILDEVVQIPGEVGMEFRAILAERHVLLATIARAWLNSNVEILFRDPVLGQETFGVVLKYSSRATPWFYDTLRDDLFAAALRNADKAIGWIVAAMLHGVEGYEANVIITKLRGRTDLLATASEEVAFIVQRSAADAPQLTLAAGFWQALLDAKRAHVPAEALRSSGRWAFVNGLAEDDWARLTSETLRLTGGLIDYAIEVADRCQQAPMPTVSTGILLMLLGKGEPWERHHISGVAFEALRVLSETRGDENFDVLRTRLIELGRDDAADLMPYEDPQED